jgi:hypothetical protein
MNRFLQYGWLLVSAISITSCSGTPFGQNLEQAFQNDQQPEQRPVKSPNRPSEQPQQPQTVGQPSAQPLLTSQPEPTLQVEEAPPDFQAALKDLLALDALPGAQGNPNQPITRREFARWLVASNNLFFRDQPGRRIREAERSATPAFKDVQASDPDFPAIQGLAEAGIIPSPLRGDLTQTQFKPDAPLNRGDLILWKAPLDSRQPLPLANLNALEQTWGFQDAKQIPPPIQRALLSDYQSGEQANLRRVFGFTTLFQSKKPVTQAEAAAALSYFGYQGEGVSAAQLRTQPSTTTSRTTSGAAGPAAQSPTNPPSTLQSPTAPARPSATPSASPTKPASPPTPAPSRP